MKMNKFAIIAASFLAFGGSAAFAAKPEAKTEATECCAAKAGACVAADCVAAGKDCPTDARCTGDKGRKGHCRVKDACRFEGLNLTDAQRESIQKINSECRQARADKKAERREAAGKERADYLAKIKEVLTPEQYVKFLENEYVKARSAAGRDFRKGKAGMERRFDSAAHDRTPRRQAPKPAKVTE